MRIAQVAPLYESVPPPRYGGTERVVHWLTEELVRLGHDVTLFASADSRTRARLVPCAPRAIREDGYRDDQAAHVRMIERVHAARAHFDVVHFHTGTVHFDALARWDGPPAVTTMHGRIDDDDTRTAMRAHPRLAYVSISHEQRAPLPQVRWVATVHHGLPADLFAPGDGGPGLAFLGRISPEKRPDRAIHIARAARLPLRIAAKVDVHDALYFAQVVQPLLENGEGVDFLGEVGDPEKSALLRASRALLLPIDWPEPFGLVMIEALACGTPVVVWNNGSAPSIVEHGHTGFVVSTIAEAIDAVHDTEHISRAACRASFERRFTVERMARAYVDVYDQLARAEEPLERAVGAQ